MPYVRFFVQAMSGVPSVVAGLFILTVFILTGVLDNSAFAAGLASVAVAFATVALLIRRFGRDPATSATRDSA